MIAFAGSVKLFHRIPCFSDNPYLNLRIINLLYLMKHIYTVLLTGLCLFLLGIVPLWSQERYPGNVDSYVKKLPCSLEGLYNRLYDGASDPSEIQMIAEGFKEHYVAGQAVFVPDFMDYTSKTAEYTVEKYIWEFSKKYSSYINQGAMFDSQVSNLQPLGAYWTDDKKGIMINVVYDNVVKADDHVVFKGKSQAMVVFPSQTDVNDIRIKQLTAYKGAALDTGSRSSTANTRTTTTARDNRRPSQGTGQSSISTPVRSNSGMASEQFRQAEKADKSLQYGKALELYKNAANMGSTEALVKLGMIFEYGYGDIVSKDFEQAASFYAKAADKGSVEGCYRYAMCLRRGRGVSKNIPMARRLLEVAAQNGHKQAAIELNKL